MIGKSKLIRYKPALIICLLPLALLLGCASQPLSCSYPVPPLSLMKPPPTQDQLCRLAEILETNWCSTQENAKKDVSN